MSDSSKKKVDKPEIVTIDNVPRGGDEVAGEIRMSQAVVATIALLVAQKTEGIYSIGKSSLIPFGSSSGVEAEVGSKEAAVDIEVVINYGVDIRKVVNGLRREIAHQVDRMAGRKIVEVNVDVSDIHIEEEKKEEPIVARRVE